MKTHLHFCSAVLAIALFAFPGIGAPPAPQVLERGPHHRKIAHVTTTTGPGGATVAKTNRYTELTAGLHYQQNGEWLEAKEIIDIVPGGGLASQAAHQVGFAANINTIGAINMLTPDGKRLRSHVLALAYTDAKTGQSVLLGEMKDSIGERIGENQVIYRDAFTSQGFQADVRYTFTKGSLEQDVILRPGGRPPPPEAYQMTPSFTRLEVFTEFLEAPEPEIKQTVLSATTDPVERAAMVFPDFVEQNLNFGAMHMPAGKAFPVGGENDDSQAIPTGKTWVALDGRRILVEAVEYPAIKSHLDLLAANPPALNPAMLAAKVRPSRTFPSAPLQARRATDTMRTAALAPKQGGFTIDYTIMTSGLTNFTFRSDSTYYVQGSAPLFLWGTSVLEGGACIKFTNTLTPQMRLAQGVDCRTYPYNPAIFTSMHDNTVGETIAGSTGNPTNYCGLAMVYLGNSSSNYFNLHDLRVSYAKNAFYGTLKVNADISNCQITHSLIGFKNNTAFWNLRNILIADVQSAFDGITPLTNSAEHITFNSVSNFVINSLPAVNLTNSLLIRVTNNVSWVGTGVETNLSDAGIFQTVGASAHYLADESPYRNVGTAGIDPVLLAGLRQRTTYPPTVLSNTTVFCDVTLSPIVMRDTDTPDLGYHFDVIDYAVSSVLLTNATMQIEPGTTIAAFNPGTNYIYGLGIGHNGKLQANGRADSKVNIVHYSTVQEMANTNWNGRVVSLIETLPNVTGSPELRCQFTDFFPGRGNNGTALYSWSGSLPWRFTDCQFLGGLVANLGSPSYFTNCLFNRSVMTLAPGTGIETFFGSCTTYGGQFVASPVDGNNTYIRDTLFADSAPYVYPFVISTNIGYFGSSDRLTPTNNNDVILSALPFQSGLLGHFYLTNCALTNASSRNADTVGLYYFTTATNQVKETNSILDISFHYIATDSTGILLDADLDGIPDYWEDRNGNGTLDTGGVETDSQTYTSKLGIGPGPGLITFTPLR